MSLINLVLPTQVNMILNKLGVKVFLFSELIENITLTSVDYGYLCEVKGFFDVEKNIIAVEDTQQDKFVEIVLHELVHLTGTNKHLGRHQIMKSKLQLKAATDKNIVEKEYDTEEAVAQLGMFKLATHLGLDPIHYGNSTLEYLKHYPKANIKRAERESDKAVDYLVSLIENKKVA